jgi:dienelactone hydrolase
MANEDAATPAGEAGPEPPRNRWQRLRGGLASLWQAILPGERARAGAAWGAIAGAAFFAAAAGVALHPGFGRLDRPAGVLLALLIAALIGLAVVLAVKLLVLLPRFIGWSGLAALGAVIVALGFTLPRPLNIWVGLAVAATEAVLFGALFLLLGKDRPGPRKRIALAAAALLALGANIWLASWLFDRGDREHLVRPRQPDPVKIEALAAPDPAQPGPYRVLSLTYGSGTDRWRPEYGSEAALKTASVDATPFLKGNEGWRIGVRDWFWGFGFAEFPRNGRVWYPDGEGPFPLALIVHGNHQMADFSDPGYEWLGRLLASRGIILVSVDENFFNGTVYGGLDRENDGRGWMLLKHLELWRDWNAKPGNPFAGKVDLEKIAVMGHSRGGEAAAIAASFNRLPRYPDDGEVQLGFDFSIRAVVAIAPSDGQYKPAGKPAPVSGVSYLLLQGGHDGDVSVFLGERLYRRLSVAGDRYHFKTILYSYRSNHGQWNTVWGDADLGEVDSVLLNREALLTAEDQRRLGAVYISAFLEATLKDDRRYLRLFRDGRSASALLPEDLYITRFEDNSFRPLASFEEDVDLTTGTLPGTAIASDGLAQWKEKDLGFRQGEGTKQNQVAVLGWKNDAAAPQKSASYALRLAPGGPGPEPGAVLVFSLADTGEDPPDPAEKNKKKEGEKSDAEKQEDERKQKEREAKKERDKKEGKEPLDLSIELAMDDGTAVRLPLSKFRALPLPLRSRFTKLKNESELYGADWEPVLQTFELPLAAFAAEKPGFEPARLAEIRFVFDRSPEGLVLLDDVGFAAGAADL